MSDNIPFDIQIDIMNRLPMNSLLQFRIVSKQWKFSIDNFEFIRNYGVRKRNSYCFNLSYKHDNQGFIYSVDENLAFKHMDSNLNIISLTPVASSEVSTLSSKTWYNLDYDCLPRESIRIKRAGQAVIDGKIFWIGLESFITMMVRVREFSPSYYISQLGDSLIISGSFDFGDCRIIYAWELEVEGGFVSSCSLMFTIPHPTGNYLKLLRFSKDNQPIVEATIVQ
ncbi:F-box domain containing protein [Tanacetum coccineum]